MSRASTVLAAGTLFITSLGYGLVIPILPQLGGGMSGTGAALVFVAFAVAKVAAQPPGGVQVDRLGAERVLRMGLLAYAVSLLGFLCGSLPVLVVARLVEGAATGLVYVAAMALAARGDPDAVGRRIGIVGAVGTSGLLIGPVLGFVLTPLGLGVPVLVGFGAAAAGSIAAFAVPAHQGTDSAHGVGLAGLIGLARDPAFVGRLSPVAFNKTAFTAFQGLAPLLGPAFLGLEERGVTFLFVAAGIGFGVAQPIGGWLADRYEARTLQLAVAPPLFAAVVGMSFPVTFWPAFAAWVVLGSIAFAVAMRDLVRSYPDEHVHGRVLAGYHTWTDLGTIAGPGLFLPLYDQVGAHVFIGLAMAYVPFVILYASLSDRAVRDLDAKRA